jgi:hypothetical protein
VEPDDIEKFDDGQRSPYGFKVADVSNIED